MKDVSQHTYGLKRGCLVSFGNRQALIQITQNCHSALFWISPERFWFSSLLSLSLSACLSFPLSLLQTLPCVMWRAQSPISKHQAEFTASFQVFVFLPLSSPPSLHCRYYKRRVEIWVPFMADSPVCSWNVPPVVDRHVWCATACQVCRWIFSGLLLVSSGSAVIDYEIQRRAFGRHTSPLARCLTTIDFLGPCLCWCIKRVLSSPWYTVLLTTVSHSLSPFPSPWLFLSFLFSSLVFPPSFSAPFPPPSPLQRPYLCCFCNVLCIKSSLSLTPAVDRSEGWETRCNAIFYFVFTGGIFYHEDEFLRGDGGQGKYHHSVLF